MPLASDRLGLGLAVVAAFTLGSSSGTARPEFRPHEGPAPVLVWVETDFLTAPGSELPRVLLYEDGELVYLKRSDPVLYHHRLLQGAELQTFKKKLKALTALPSLRSWYNIEPELTDMPSTVFYLREGERERVTEVYGLASEGAGWVATTILRANRPADVPPKPIFELHRFLASLDDAKGSDWRPRYVEAVIRPYQDAIGKSIQWPADWPSLTSDRAVRRGEDGYSLYLDAALESKLGALLAKRDNGEAVEIGGKRWRVEVKPVFPSEPTWRKALRNIGPGH